MNKTLLVGLAGLASFVTLLVPGYDKAEADPCPPTAEMAQLDLPAARAAVDRGTLKIVALGSSSTFGRGSSWPDKAYPAQLQQALAREMPDIDVQVVNLGINGQDAPEELLRMDDVAKLSPDVTIWQLGTNFALQTGDPALFAQEVDQGVARLRASGADVVLMDNQRCPMLAAVAGHGAAEDDVLAREAASGKAGIFKRGVLMDGWVRSGRPLSDFLIKDGLHQNDLGYLCLARALAGSLMQGLHRR